MNVQINASNVDPALTQPTKASRVMDTIVKVALAALAAGVALALVTGMPFEALIVTTIVVGVVLTPLFYTCFPRPLFIPSTWRYRTPILYPYYGVRRVFTGFGGHVRRPDLSGPRFGRTSGRRPPPVHTNPVLGGSPAKFGGGRSASVSTNRRIGVSPGRFGGGVSFSGGRVAPGSRSARRR